VDGGQLRLDRNVDLVPVDATFAENMATLAILKHKALDRRGHERRGLARLCRILIDQEQRFLGPFDGCVRKRVWGRRARLSRIIILSVTRFHRLCLNAFEHVGPG
jgi:hypothetical protein